MHPELKEMVYGTYLKLADSACSELRNLEQVKSHRMDEAIKIMERKSEFLIDLPEQTVASISSITRRNQQECEALLDDAFHQLGIQQYPSLTKVIRQRIGILFGLVHE